jgi:hypothetical protein
MAASKYHPAHDWDLWLVVYAIVALSAATDICGFRRFAPTLGLPIWAGVLCVVPIKLIEWQFLTFANRLFQNGLLASADRVTAKRAETRANLVAAFEGVKAQLGTLSKPIPRPVKVVEQALAWYPLLPELVHRATHDCTRFPGGSLPEACKGKVELRKELAAATEYERLSQRSEELRIQLEGIDIGAARDAMPRSFEISFGRFVNLDGKDGIATMGMMILTLVSAFGPFGLYIVGRAGKSTTSVAPALLDGESAQAIGRDGKLGAQADRAPRASVGHVQSAQGHAHAARPAVKTAQLNGVPPDATPSCSNDKPAHDPAQLTLLAGARTSEDQTAHDYAEASPPMPEPARMSIGHRPKRPTRPGHPGASNAAQIVCLDRHLKSLPAVRSFVSMLEHASCVRQVLQIDHGLR